MGEIFGHKWASQYGDRPSALWCAMLAQLTDDQVRAGIALLVSSGETWPPGLPEFRKLCVEGPVAYGLPSPDDAWSEAQLIARRWKRPHEVSHQVVWHALSQIGHFTVLDEETLEKRFRKNYERAVSDFAAGKGLQAIPQPLPPPEKASPSNRSPEEQARFLAEIDAKLEAAGIRRRATA